MSKKLSDICRREVEAELSEHSTPPANEGRTVNGHANGRVVDTAPKLHTSRVRLATDAQIRAIHAIASKAKVRLASELDSAFGVSSPQSLTLQEASILIEKLKSQIQPS